MKYSYEKLEKSQVKFTIDIDATEIEAAIQEAYNKNKSKFKLEGFRPGKVPRKVLEAEFGKDVFLNDAIDIILPKYFGEALDKEITLDPVGRPEADIVDISTEAMKFTVTIAVKPEVKLGEYKGIKIEKVKADVTDKDLDDEIKRLQSQHARVSEVEKDRKCKKGDIANIDFTGYRDGQKFDGGEGKDYDLELGSNTFIPGFEDGVVGMKKGEEKDIVLKFPEDYGAADLAGKEVTFKVKLNGIKVSELPELNDDFAKDVSEFDTFEEYKNDIKAGLLKSAEERAKSEEEYKLVDTIVENSEVEVPDAMVEEEIEQLIQEFEYRLNYQGMKLDDYLKYSGATRDQMHEQYKDVALKNVKTRLILEEIIKKEEIKPDEEAVNKKLEEMAKNANKPVDEFKKGMNPQYFDYLLNQSLTDAVRVKLEELNPIK